MVSGDWHKGRGVWGQGVPWKTKAGSHSSQKKEEGRSERGNVWEFLFVCPGENLRSFPVLLSSLSSHLLLWFFLLITLSHEARLPSRTAPDLWHWLIYMSTGTNTTHNPTRVSCCVCVCPVSVTNFASCVFLVCFVFCMAIVCCPQSFSLLFLLHLLSSFFVWPYCSQLHFFFSHVFCCSVPPLRPDIKGSMRISLPSPPRYTPARNRTIPSLTHTHACTQSQTPKCGRKCWQTSARMSLKSRISSLGSDLYGRLTVSTLTHRRHALRTLAKSCKGLKGMTHMCTHTHKHKAPCVFFTVSKQWPSGCQQSTKAALWGL